MARTQVAAVAKIRIGGSYHKRPVGNLNITILQNMSSSMGRTIPYMMEHVPFMFQTTNQVRLFFREQQSKISALFFPAGPPFFWVWKFQQSEEPGRWETWVPETCSETEAVKSTEVFPESSWFFGIFGYGLPGRSFPLVISHRYGKRPVYRRFMMTIDGSLTY